MNDWAIGETVVLVGTAHYMSNIEDDRFYPGEEGVIVHLTKRTMHVKDPRGGIHKRPFIKMSGRCAFERVDRP